ncbi:type II toxin-antitoxin system RelE/ParE family toxin [Sandarakinorhabdus sp.]|uniref:type II toxin-antitoxin system RelE/ParE family toxin n=1 Tax=Sandarakinorhabdus sp. TaxID=1916663 RepID=UPI003F715570
MTPVALSGLAQADLQRIGDWIAENAGVVTALAYLDRIEAACANLADFPHRGTPRPDLGPGVRTVSFEGRATIVYRVEADSVLVLGIFHAGRLLEGPF